MTISTADQLAVLLRTLKLPSFVAGHEEAGKLAERESWGFSRYLLHLAESEIADRKERRIERLLRQSSLPSDKTLATLDQSKLPVKVRRILPTLCEGQFLERAENILAFGLPGRGKTHCASAIGHELVKRGHEVLFVPAFALVQRLLVAKRDLNIEREMRRLDRFDAVILDDLGYIQQDRAEMEVLFTFLAERYERRSVIITSNLVFSQWDKIFKDPMTTAAAIDRVVHHSVILEMTGESHRSDAAKKNQAVKAKAAAET
jgi:DNA replication protein DnaC